MSILAISVSYDAALELRFFLESVLAILPTQQDLKWVILENPSPSADTTFMDGVSHPQLEFQRLPENIGKGNAVNAYLRSHLNRENLPDVLVSVDADILFSPTEFAALVQATRDLPNVGFLSMRYRQNNCQPERNLWLPARTHRGQSGAKYKIKHPFLCNVAGGVIALPGRVLAEDLNFELYPKADGQTYYPDDAFLYDTLKKRGRLLGYLQGTAAWHLRSGPNRDLPTWTPSV